MAVVLPFIAAGGTVASARANSRAASAQRDANRAQQRQADIANARERRAAIRAARVARSSVESQAATSGIIGSSSVAGSMSNITSATNENISFLDQNQQLNSRASAANRQASSWAARGATFEVLGALAGKLEGRVPKTKVGK